MHQHANLTNFIHVLAVDFDIVDGNAAVQNGVAEDEGWAGGAEELLTFCQLNKRYSVVAVQTTVSPNLTTS